jgi:hypothetical protein
MGCAHFFGQMSKPFTLTLCISEVGPLDFIRSIVKIRVKNNTLSHTEHCFLLYLRTSISDS